MTQVSSRLIRRSIRSPHSRSCGFSLIELSVALIIVALLVGSLLVPLTTQVDQKRNTEARKQLEQVQEALIGFALAKHYFPCPAKSATDGLEDRDTSTNQCTLVSGNPKRTGYLPWVTLGISPYDPWDNMLRYSVDPNFARSDPNFFFKLGNVGDIRIRTRDPAGSLVDLTNPEIPAAVFSHGKNGYGAISSSGVTRVVPGSWTGDEQTNATGSTSFVSRERTENTGAIGGEFDDVVAWVSLNQLFARMVAGGRLPYTP